ncbi:MAG: hypothetical protein EON54_20755 [Alcaligenaceae bacterium]|nr:MAG: hypothetical protein EON54_20755 [Alcaligenaceae bacterium]
MNMHSSSQHDVDRLATVKSTEQPTYDAMMRALDVQDWDQYFALSKDWYGMFQERRALEKRAVSDPLPPN